MDCKWQRTNADRLNEDDETQESSKRNPGILLALDAVHRSLLSNNLKYEGKMRGNLLRPFLVFFFSASYYRSHSKAYE